MPSDEEKLKSIKTEIRSLIVSSPVRLTLEKFLRDYKECIGFTLPFNDFGHKNAQDFLNSMPDVVQLKKTASGILLVPVEYKLVSHINDLVSKQRNTRKNSTFKPRITTFDNRRYYQVTTSKNKNRRPKERYNVRPEGQNSSDSSIGLDDIDSLHTDRTTEYHPKHVSNIMSYGQTKHFSPPRRSSPTSTQKDELLETISISQTTSCEEYDDHENSDECRSSQFDAVIKPNCYSPGNLSTSDSESEVASEQFFLDNNSGSSCTSRFADNESSNSVFDSPDSSIFGNTESRLEDGAKQFATIKYGQTLHYRPIGGPSSCNEKDYGETPFQLQPKSTRCSDTPKEDSHKSSETDTNGKIEKDFYVSIEHEIYLTALVHGIVLDSSKVLDPYKHLLHLEQSSKIRNDVDINLIQSPQKRNIINSSSTSLKECKLNIGSDMKDKYAANNDGINNIHKILSKFREMFNDKPHCSNENTENESILRDDSSQAPTETNVNKNSSHESICDRNYFHHPEDAISEGNTVRKDLNAIDRCSFVKQYLQSKQKQLGCTNEKTSPYSDSSSFGRDSALKNLLKLYQEQKSKGLGDVSSGTNNPVGVIGRGRFMNQNIFKFRN